jgi:hypothetical protein
MLPDGMQAPAALSQQPPPPHWPPVQHGCPGLPHAAQASCEHTSAPDPHSRPGQHGCPAPPHT